MCNNSFKLTKRAMDLMNILWKADTSLAASEFPKYDNTLTVHTAQAYLKMLLQKELIKVDKIITSRNNLTRCYKPTLSRTDFETKKYFSSLDYHKISVTKLVLSFFEYEKDAERELKELTELEQLIKMRKKNLDNKTSE